MITQHRLDVGKTPSHFWRSILNLNSKIVFAQGTPRQEVLKHKSPTGAGPDIYAKVWYPNPPGYASVYTLIVLRVQDTLFPCHTRIPLR